MRRKTRETEVVYDEPDVAYEDEPVVEERATSTSGVVNIAEAWTRLLAFVVMTSIVIVEAMLGFRLGFLASAANRSNGFVDAIYDSTGPLVEPFQGIISNDSLSGGGIFEYATVIAMAVFLLAAVLLVWALWAALAAAPREDTYAASRTKRRHHPMAH